MAPYDTPPLDEVLPEADGLPVDLLDLAERRVPRYTSYPTAPHFQSAFPAETHGAWLAALPADAHLSLYLHVPFCRQLCWYCGCATQAVNTRAPIAEYVEDLEREIALVAAALGNKRQVVRIHWGGGTPLSLEPEDLSRLDRSLRAAFDVLPGAEVAVEIDPRRLDKGRFEALLLMGVNRVSLGVQDLDPDVQKLIGREQPFEVVAAAVAGLRAVGLKSISFDLIYGLPGQTVATIHRTAAQALSLNPERIAIFGYAHVPWARGNQALIDATLLPGPSERSRLAHTAERTILAGGYLPVGLDHFAAPHDSLAWAAQHGRLRRGFQGFTDDPSEVVVGIGASSISTLPHGYAQNAAQVPPWREAIRAGRLPSARGRALTAEDRFRRHIIERLMCGFSVDLEAAAVEHGQALDTLAAALVEVDRLVARGVAVRDGWTVGVSKGRELLVRVIAAAFDTYLKPDGPGHASAV